MVTTAHEQNILCSKIHLDGTKCDKTSICRQLFAGHVASGSLNSDSFKMKLTFSIYVQKYLILSKALRYVDVEDLSLKWVLIQRR